MDSAAIKEVNKEVTAVIASTGGKRKRYLKLTDEQRATIGHYAAEHGIAKVIHHFIGDFPPDSLKKSTIRGSKKAYLQELQSRRREGKGFFPKLYTEAMQSQKFSKKSMQLQKFSTTNDLHLYGILTQYLAILDDHNILADAVSRHSRRLGA